MKKMELDFAMDCGSEKVTKFIPYFELMATYIHIHMLANICPM